MNRGRALSQLSACLHGRIPEKPDWFAILALANETLVTTELYPLLDGDSEFAQRVPDDARDLIVEIHRRNTIRSAALLHTLKDVLETLNPAGVEPVLLKGCATWASDGGEIASSGERVVGDLDLLVPDPAFDIAVHALMSAGFNVLEDLRELGHHRVVVLGRPVDAGTIDLHRRAPGPRGVPEIDDLVHYCRPATCSGLRAKVPAAEHQILISVLHDQFLDGHFWRGGFDLRHLLDIARLSRRGGIDWSMLLKLCRNGRLRSAMLAQLVAAKRIAAAEIPAEAAKSVWAELHYRRQRLQFTWRAVNRMFHELGFTRAVWQPLSLRALR